MAPRSGSRRRLQTAASGLAGTARLPPTRAAERGHRRRAAGSAGWAGPRGLARNPPREPGVHTALGPRRRRRWQLPPVSNRAQRHRRRDPVAGLINSGLGCCVRLFQLPVGPQRSPPVARSVIQEANRCVTAPQQVRREEEVAGLGDSLGAFSLTCTHGNQWGFIKMHVLTRLLPLPLHRRARAGSGNGCRAGARGAQSPSIISKMRKVWHSLPRGGTQPSACVGLSCQGGRWPDTCGL